MNHAFDTAKDIATRIAQRHAHMLAGEAVTITRRGVPVARLEPAQEVEPTSGPMDMDWLNIATTMRAWPAMGDDQAPAARACAAGPRA